MTKEHILAVCRSNWEYRGVDDASVREMLTELSAHLEDAEAAGRTTRDVVGEDVKAFAASWARARAPLSRRALRTVSMACFVLGSFLLLSCLIQRTTQVPVTAGRVAFYAAFATITVAWEMRRGRLGFTRSWAVSLAVGLPAGLLTWWLAADGVLFTLPLWAAVALLLPGLPYAVVDARARKGADPVAG
ncbi:hypothetical protein [Streptomyces sp. I05A-00742]|uniref:hypothetical protein n=1 Tax=Streptomyces sp. I05A-00742 TaxID=2732853 RepID=UPI001487E3CB|nr:hypothetical protein [Streptomyces sp. I05A-00742]